MLRIAIENVRLSTCTGDIEVIRLELREHFEERQQEKVSVVGGLD